ncbi:hypothetical protein Misp04_10040 [Micromonospora sp. NBRC 101691]|nr:hypothetical protein Misp04_10040 [Micromonospora sp. NBRC 101691]
MAGAPSADRDREVVRRVTPGPRHQVYCAPTVTTQAYSWHRARDCTPAPTQGPYAVYWAPLFSSQRT